MQYLAEYLCNLLKVSVCCMLTSAGTRRWSTCFVCVSSGFINIVFRPFLKMISTGDTDQHKNAINWAFVQPIVSMQTRIFTKLPVVMCFVGPIGIVSSYSRDLPAPPASPPSPG
jgi:hypothetical protein